MCCSLADIVFGSVFRQKPWFSGFLHGKDYLLKDKFSTAEEACLYTTESKYESSLVSCALAFNLSTISLA